MLPLVTGEMTAILLKKSAPVQTPLSLDILALIPEMIETMRLEKGIGLAAPQIGRSLQLCVIECEKKNLVLINPKITSLSQEKILFEEGCLSLPGQFYQIIRSEKLVVEYINERGLPKKIRATGLLAVVIQHEIDHLNGILIVNRFKKQQAKSPKKQSL